MKSRVKELEDEVEDISDELSKMQSLNEKLQGMYDSTKRSHDILVQEKGQLIADVQTLQEKLKEAFEVGMERLDQLTKVTEDLSQARMKLENEQKRSQELEETADAWKANATDMEEQFEQSQSDLSECESKLESVVRELAQAREQVEVLKGQLQELEDDKAQLEKQFENEQLLHSQKIGSLTEQFEEERQSSKKALEATKEILEAKHKQEMMEQSKNMNKLLEDERKASRMARDEIEQIREEKRVAEQDSEQKLKLAQKELDETIIQMKKEKLAEVEAAIKKTTKQYEEKHNEIVRNGREMINHVKAQCKAELEKIDDQKSYIENQLQQKNQEFEEFQRKAESEMHALGQKRNYLEAENIQLTSDLAEQKDNYETLKRDLDRIQEENDYYRRQVGGRSGADGTLQTEYEKLRKEYNILLDENQQLKNRNRQNMNESFVNSSEEGAYESFGGISRNSVAQVRLAYEEEIEKLKDEKRELLMKQSAAHADKEKSEKRVWEREEEIQKLKAEVTSLKLALAKSEVWREEQNSKGDSFQSPTNQSSFYSAQETEDGRCETAAGNNSPPRATFPMYSPYNPSTRSSPGIDRAKREKAQREQNVRNSLSNVRAWSDSPSRKVSNQSFSTSPPRPSPVKASPNRRLAPGVSHLVSSFEPRESSILSPTQKHEQSTNILAAGERKQHFGRNEGNTTTWGSKRNDHSIDQLPSLFGKPDGATDNGTDYKPPSEWLTDKVTESEPPSEWLNNSGIADGDGEESPECQQS